MRQEEPRIDNRAVMGEGHQSAKVTGVAPSWSWPFFDF